MIDKTYYDEQTLFKVQMALIKAGLSAAQVTMAINELQNEGILFRERVVD